MMACKTRSRWIGRLGSGSTMVEFALVISFTMPLLLYSFAGLYPEQVHSGANRES
jgi:hypothetical protein